MGKKDVKVSRQIMKDAFFGLKNYTWNLASESRQTEGLTQDILALLYRLYYVPGHGALSIEAREGTKPTSIKNFKRQVSRILSKSSTVPSRQLTQTGSINSVETAKLESKAAVANAGLQQTESAFVLIGVTKEALFDTEAQLELRTELNRLRQLCPNTKVVLTIFNDTQSAVSESRGQQLKLKQFSEDNLHDIQRGRAQLLKSIDKAADFISVMVVNTASIDAGDRKELYLHASAGTDWHHATQRFKSAFPELEQQRDIDDTNFEYLSHFFKISAASDATQPAFTSYDEFRRLKGGGADVQQAASAPVFAPTAERLPMYPGLPSSLPDSFHAPLPEQPRERSRSFYHGFDPQQMSGYPDPAMLTYAGHYGSPPAYMYHQMHMQPQTPAAYPYAPPPVAYGHMMQQPQQQQLSNANPLPYAAPTTVVGLRNPQVMPHSSAAFDTTAPVTTTAAVTQEQERQAQEKALLAALANLRTQQAPSAPPAHILEEQSGVRALTAQWEQKTSQQDAADGKTPRRALNLAGGSFDVPRCSNS